MAEARVWMEAPRTETLVPLQRDRWKRKLILQDGRMDDGLNDPAERNEEPPD